MNICFVAHFAYGALTGDPRGHIGGVERQTALMSRWLVNRGHQVSVCTWTEGLPADETLDGVRILKICPADAGLPMLRFVHPRWTGLCAAMRRANADIYYQNCAEAITGQVALWARRNDRRFVFSVASDPECDPSLPILESQRERVLYRKGLTLADGIITQTSVQQRMLQDGFGLRATPLPMPSDIHVEGSFAEIDAARESDFSVLWVGRMMPVKRPEIFLELAKALPDIRFHMVGGVDQDAKFSERIFKQAEDIPNLVMHGRKAREEVLDLYRRCHVLCCTSTLEGFPNTFLEAFAHGMPVVSTVDPDDLLKRFEIGAHCESVEALVSTLGKLARHRALTRASGEAAWQYYYGQHALDKAMPRFEAFLETQAIRP